MHYSTFNIKEEFFNKEKPHSLKIVFLGLNFNENYNVVNFINRYTREELTTNLARVTETSKDEKINKLIVELNESYDKIVNIKNEFKIE